MSSKRHSLPPTLSDTVPSIYERELSDLLASSSIASASASTAASGTARARSATQVSPLTSRIASWCGPCHISSQPIQLITPPPPSTTMTDTSTPTSSSISTSTSESQLPNPHAQSMFLGEDLRQNSGIGMAGSESPQGSMEFLQSSSSGSNEDVTQNNGHGHSLGYPVRLGEAILASAPASEMTAPIPEQTCMPPCPSIITDDYGHDNAYGNAYALVQRNATVRPAKKKVHQVPQVKVASQNQVDSMDPVQAWREMTRFGISGSLFVEDLDHDVTPDEIFAFLSSSSSSSSKSMKPISTVTSRLLPKDAANHRRPTTLFFRRRRQARLSSNEEETHSHSHSHSYPHSHEEAVPPLTPVRAFSSSSVSSAASSSISAVTDTAPSPTTSGPPAMIRRSSRTKSGLSDLAGVGARGHNGLFDHDHVRVYDLDQDEHSRSILYPEAQGGRNSTGSRPQMGSRSCTSPSVLPTMANIHNHNHNNVASWNRTSTPHNKSKTDRRASIAIIVSDDVASDYQRRQPRRANTDTSNDGNTHHNASIFPPIASPRRKRPLSSLFRRGSSSSASIQKALASNPAWRSVSPLREKTEEEALKLSRTLTASSSSYARTSPSNSESGYHFGLGGGGGGGGRRTPSGSNASSTASSWHRFMKRVVGGGSLSPSSENMRYVYPHSQTSPSDSHSEAHLRSHSPTDRRSSIGSSRSAASGQSSRLRHVSSPTPEEGSEEAHNSFDQRSISSSASASGEPHAHPILPIISEHQHTDAGTDADVDLSRSNTVKPRNHESGCSSITTTAARSSSPASSDDHMLSPQTQFHPQHQHQQHHSYQHQHQHQRQHQHQQHHPYQHQPHFFTFAINHE